MRRTLLAATTILLLTAGCTGSDDPATKPTTTASPTTLVDYGDDGVTVSSPDDVAKLTGAPADFTSFVVDELRRQQDVKDEVCTEKPQIKVSRVDTRGWAAGGTFIPQCGGNAALWAEVDGAWREVWNGQTLPECTVLEKYEFPADVAGAECGTADGETRRYP